jgi:branched-chain amino acid transport system ATP-binding protein
MSEPLLRIRALSKRFGGVQALEDVSLDVAPGAIVGIMGANGAGKTTLFALVAGNEAPTSGDIRLAGESIVGLRPDQICRRGVARTYQIVRPFAGLSVLENVTTAALFGAGRHASHAAAEAHARVVIEAIGLGERMDSPAGELTLSGQKRLEIARAVATGAQLVMLDEVMAGLTAPEVEDLLATIRRLQAERGLTVLVIEHVMRALMRLSDHIVVLHLGRKLAEGTPQAVAQNADVLRVYFGNSVGNSVGDDARDDAGEAA